MGLDRISFAVWFILYCLNCFGQKIELVGLLEKLRKLEADLRGIAPYQIMGS